MLCKVLLLSMPVVLPVHTIAVQGGCQCSELCMSHK